MDGPRLKLLYITPGHAFHDARFARVFEDEDIEARMLRLSPSISPTEAVSAIRDAIADFRPQLTLAGEIPTGARYAVHAHAPRVVAMSWGSDVLVGAFASDAARHAAAEALHGSVALFADTPAVVRAAEALSPGISARSFTMPWGIDVARFAPRDGTSAIRDQLGWMEYDVFISTRNWEPVHDVGTLIRAFALVRNERPRARLILGGAGSQREIVHSLISDLGVGQSVHEVGAISNAALPEYLHAADVYVSSAVSDGASVSLLEAMGCGKPVIAVARYGNLDWIADGRNGWLTEPGDADALAGVMLEAMQSRTAWPAMASENRRLVCNQANWTENVARFADFLRDVSGRGEGE